MKPCHRLFTCRWFRDTALTSNYNLLKRSAHTSAFNTSQRFSRSLIVLVIASKNSALCILTSCIRLDLRPRMFFVVSLNKWISRKVWNKLWHTQQLQKDEGLQRKMIEPCVAVRARFIPTPHSLWFSGKEHNCIFCWSWIVLVMQHNFGESCSEMSEGKSDVGCPLLNPHAEEKKAMAYRAVLSFDRAFVPSSISLVRVVFKKLLKIKWQQQRISRIYHKNHGIWFSVSNSLVYLWVSDTSLILASVSLFSWVSWAVCSALEAKSFFSCWSLQNKRKIFAKKRVRKSTVGGRMSVGGGSSTFVGGFTYHCLIDIWGRGGIMGLIWPNLVLRLNHGLSTSNIRVIEYRKWEQRAHVLQMTTVSNIRRTCKRNTRGNLHAILVF